ncbi:MAG: hypothetical protein LBR80_15265 [Deltaproteobacteria bacterium]|jgi:hypothetical protein|nr:hypothetical protein [Deltaproteobacteria bacterium]
MSKDKYYSLVDQVSRRIISSVEEIDRDLSELEGSEASSVRGLLPAVLLSISVLRLCQENPPDEVLNILRAVSLKVETGDYHPGGMSYRDTPPPEGGSDGGGTGGDQKGKGGPTIN